MLAAAAALRFDAFRCDATLIARLRCRRYAAVFAAAFFADAFAIFAMMFLIYAFRHASAAAAATCRYAIFFFFFFSRPLMLMLLFFARCFCAFLPLLPPFDFRHCRHDFSRFRFFTR